MNQKKAFWLVLFPVTCLLAIGCGSGKTVVNGQVKRDGKPLTATGKGWIILSLIAQDNSETYSTDYSMEEGTFAIKGRDGQGIPPGKYKVAIEYKDPYPHGPDKLKGKYAPGKTALVVDVSGSKLDIDLK